MGCQRGLDLINSSLNIPNTELVYVCEVDKERMARGIQTASKKQKTPPTGVGDIRKLLEAKDFDVLFVAVPNHWHAPATILACNAGKHVYVEKPCSHNPWEGETMIKAARKNQRLVQMGNQRRSWPVLIEAVDKLRNGVIGKVFYARSWYTNQRGSIGTGRQVPVPDRLDYSLWEGPAPERPYVDNLVHYNWHWRWHWGNGELGNNGIHALDLARWGLGVGLPQTVSCSGNRYWFKDDWETPDTTLAAYDFGSSGISWDASSSHPRQQEKLPFVSFYGENGTLENHGGGYKIFDLKGKLIEEKGGPQGEQVHIQNLFDAIRDGKKQNSEIAEGHISTMLCHLGNMAYRTASTLKVDPENGHVKNNRDAMKLWKREYRRGWEPKV